ncbi:PIG-L deacetylase family protein [Pseudothermotoga sp.]|uniref:PIG-L deacetylase family protein n=1 Tax=Pseudothermotoga sp. TaxID=2033661 RepID=UPI0031F69950
MKKILIVGAHSDDPIIGVGGTIRELSKLGNSVTVLSVCGDRIEGYTEAIELLSAEPVYFDFSYAQIDEDDFFKQLEELMKKLNPDIVFTHWHSEILYDHEVVSKHTIKLARKFEKEIYLFEIPASSQDFQFDVAVDVTGSYEYKRKAIEMMKDAFKEEVFEKEIMPSIIFPTGFRGIQVGCPYAEVFKHLGSRFPLSPCRKRLLDLSKL